jgi:hemoglobin
VVDDFINRHAQPILNANPVVDEGHHRVSAAGFKYYVTEMVCWVTGGPQKYTGRSMSESHKDLKITESEWAAFCKDFDDTMARFNVPEAESKELFAIVESTSRIFEFDHRNGKRAHAEAFRLSFQYEVAQTGGIALALPGELDDKLGDRHLQLIVSVGKELEPWLNGN